METIEEFPFRIVGTFKVPGVIVYQFKGRIGSEGPFFEFVVDEEGRAWAVHLDKLFLMNGSETLQTTTRFWDSRTVYRCRSDRTHLWWAHKLTRKIIGKVPLTSDDPRARIAPDLRSSWEGILP